MVAKNDTDELMDLVRAVADQVAALQGQIAAIAEDTHALLGQAGGVKVQSGRSERSSERKREGRKRGLAAVMGRLFWDRMMQGFAAEIRANGPMTAAELYATLDEDARHMAAAAFEKIDVSLIMEKVQERVRRKHYFLKTPDGRYDVLDGPSTTPHP